MADGLLLFLTLHATHIFKTNKTHFEQAKQFTEKQEDIIWPEYIQKKTPLTDETPKLGLTCTCTCMYAQFVYDNGYVVSQEETRVGADYDCDRNRL